MTRHNVRTSEPAPVLVAVDIDRDEAGGSSEGIRARALGDQRLGELHDELLGYPGGTAQAASPTGVVLPLRYRHGDRELSFFSISTAVDTAPDVTVEELAIEAFYPPRTRPRPPRFARWGSPADQPRGPASTARSRTGRPGAFRAAAPGTRCSWTRRECQATVR